MRNMDFELKHLSGEEKYNYSGQIIKLWKECFHDTDLYCEYYVKWKIPVNEIFIILYENQVAAMIHLNPYYVKWFQENYKLYYIVGVATKQEFRKKGLMRRLLTACFDFMQKEGCPFTFLMPASPEIYEPFQFQYIYEQQRLQMTIPYCRSGGLKMESGLCSEQEYGKLCSFAGHILSTNYQLYVERNVSYYKEISEEMKHCGGELLRFYDNGNIVGCLSYMKEDNIEVVETIVEEKWEDALLDTFFTYLTEYGLAGHQIQFLETGFLQGLKKKESSAIKVFPVIMARILNKKLFMIQMEQHGMKKPEESLSFSYLNEIV